MPLSPSSASSAPKFDQFDSPSSPVWKSEKAHGLAFHNKYQEFRDLLEHEDNHQVLLKGDFMRWTSLVFATQRNNLAIVRLILSYKEGQDSIRILTRGGNTVLHFCACSNATEILREVLRYPQGREVMSVRNAQGFLPEHETKNEEIHFILRHAVATQRITDVLYSHRVREKWSDVEIVTQCDGDLSSCGCGMLALPPFGDE
eukprot:CAMPEP_0117448522 /NCGR_PEP_ID=MMETSP0759-20121206/7445_1 /TAXON_ID=63605 /ORGANISM="Percolomonas cosmopolitus, Strain WS" /LENGTH=201 /DNA_ID=CAMNT_0005240913 /DNA_START=149 /DNA_END=754 /DNA_ORIENTATION=+